MKRLGMLQHMSFVALAAMTFTAACGDDDDGGTPDARIDAPITPTFDARTVDSPAPTPDAQQADAGPTFSGTMSLHDIQIFGLPQAGHGVQAAISFSQDGKPTVASVSMPVGGIPCSASVVDVDDPAQENPDVNEGTVRFSRKPMGGTATALPDCTFVGDTYRCLFAGGGATGTITDSTMNPNVGTFDNATFSFTDAMIGSYLIVTGGAGAGNAWPIVGVSGMQAGLQESSAFVSPVGTFAVQYGVGPITFTDTPTGTATPGAPPDLIVDTDDFTVQLIPGGGSHFAAYTSTEFSAGNDFVLDTDTTNIFTDGLDLDPAGDTLLGCDDTSCPALSSLVTVVNIETTDVAGGGPTTLMPPDRFRGSLTCATLNMNKVRIPMQVLSVLQQANPRKMRISVFRDGGDLGAALSRDLNIVVGHGWVVFKDVPEPTKPQ